MLTGENNPWLSCDSCMNNPIMASSSNQTTPPSSSTTSIRRWNHDVFLSFSSKDTRYNFTDHLYTALVRKGIRTFRDEGVNREEVIEGALSKTIEESRISIVVLSENYAHSRRSLNELLKIIDCRKERGQEVLPVFYHVDPSNLRRQMGSFRKAFSNYGKETEEKVKRLMAALNEVGHLSGWHVQDGCYESNYIKDIIENVFNTLHREPLYVEKSLVGMGSRLINIISLLGIESNDVRMVGIYGCGGIGKSTITKAIHDQISYQYEGTTFLANVREVCKDPRGLVELQKQLVNDILVGENHNISYVQDGIKMIRNVLQSKKVLIILDDVDDSNQLESLAPSHKWFGEGSRIIITTRDKQLLVVHGVNEYLYEVKELNYEEAMELFSLNAFKQNIPKEGYTILSQCLVDYAKGLPLALKVLGSFLFNKTISQWKSALDKLKREPNKEIQNVLKVSFDGLDETEKDLFLDLACFFRGNDKDFVSRILDNAESGLRVLLDKGLITISENKLDMHDLLQQMGWSIVRQDCPKEPEKWSRLWEPEDVYNVLTKNTGTQAIEGIFLNVSASKPIQFTTEAFKMMNRLKLLKVHQDDEDTNRVNLFEDFQFPSHELRYLHWDRYFLESLPSNFHPENLVELNMSFSNIKQLWKGNKLLEELKVMNLNYSKILIDIPNFSCVPNLEILLLEGCKSLECLPSDIYKLKHLETLSCFDCSNLKSFPEIMENMEKFRELDLAGTAIKELSSSIELLKGLEYLNLEGCKDLVSLPNSICNLRSLQYLAVHNCSELQQLPENLGSLQCLEVLYASGIRCQLPSLSGLHSLRILDVHESNIMQGAMLSDICCFKLLEELDLGNCNLIEDRISIDSICCLSELKGLNLSGNHFSSIPAGINKLSKLRVLGLTHCKMLLRIPELPSSLRVINAHGCICLETLSSPLMLPGQRQPWHSLLKCLKSKTQELECRSSHSAKSDMQGPIAGKFFIHGKGISMVIPGSGGIPEWVRHKKRGSEVVITLPLNWYENKDFLGFALCSVYTPVLDNQSEEYELDNTFTYEFSEGISLEKSRLKRALPCYLACQLTVHGDESDMGDCIFFGDKCECFHNGDVSDQVWVTYYPQLAIQERHRSNQWRHIKASFDGSYAFGQAFKVERCGFHLIYNQDLQYN